jgi:hypothetical protein
MPGAGRWRNDCANKGGGMGFSGGSLSSREHVTTPAASAQLSHDGSPEVLAASRGSMREAAASGWP